MILVCAEDSNATSFFSGLQLLAGALCMVKNTAASPVVKPVDLDSFVNPFVSSRFCLLPPELGYAGNWTYLEDCSALDRYLSFIIWAMWIVSPLDLWNY